MKKGWTEDESTDIRTRDLARRQEQILHPHIGKPYEPTMHTITYSGQAPITVPCTPGCPFHATSQAHPLTDIPRRTDWVRVAQGTVVLVALAAASAALIVSVALLIRSVWT